MILLKALVWDDGEDVVTQWYRTASVKAQAKLDNRMLYLREQNREGWVREPYDTLRDGIGEVRFKAQGAWYCPLGYFGPGRNEFTFLLFATKTNRFSPPNAIEIATERMAVVESDPSKSIVVRNRWGQ